MLDWSNLPYRSYMRPHNDSADLRRKPTCTERQQVCFAYCEKTYNNAPKCTDACKDYLAKCMATGCWESKVTAKRCGFAKQ